MFYKQLDTPVLQQIMVEQIRIDKLTWYVQKKLANVRLSFGHIVSESGKYVEAGGLQYEIAGHEYDVLMARINKPSEMSIEQIIQ